MDHAQIALVQSSFQEIIGVSDEFSRIFYEHLFQLDGSLRTMFAEDMTAQRQKLVDELIAIVDCLGRLTPLVERTTDLGRRHAEYGVEPHHYDLVLDALVHAIGVVLGDSATSDVVTAWRRAYHLVAETMLRGAAAAVDDLSL